MSQHPQPASLARRALPALAVLGASGALLTQLGGSETAGAQTISTTGATARVTAQTPATVTPTTVPSTASQTPARPGTATASTTTIPSTRQPPSGGAAPAPQSATPTTVPPATAAACTGTKVTGASVSTRFGPVQVEVTLGANKTICDVNAVAYPSADRKSLAINQRAIPTLRTQAITANSANIAGVSGATVTTVAYRSSLQSALDAAK